jgi:hypothetical protein
MGDRRRTSSRIIHRENFYLRSQESGPCTYSQVRSLQTAWTLTLRRLPPRFPQPMRPQRARQKFVRLRPFHNFCGQLVDCPVYAAFLEQHQSLSCRCSKFRREFLHAVKGLPPVLKLSDPSFVGIIRAFFIVLPAKAIFDPHGTRRSPPEEFYPVHLSSVRILAARHPKNNYPKISGFPPGLPPPAIIVSSAARFRWRATYAAHRSSSRSRDVFG